MFQGSPNLARRIVGRAAIACLAASLLAPAPARANSLSEGERAYARQDYARAAALLSREAEKGRATAQAYLGYMYSYGLGLPQDYIEAARWLRRAADQGEPTAQYLLGLAYDKGHGVKQDFVEAEALLDLAVAHADARRRDGWTVIRNAVKNKLTRAELREAQDRALAFTLTPER